MRICCFAPFWITGLCVLFCWSEPERLPRGQTRGGSLFALMLLVKQLVSLSRQCLWNGFIPGALRPSSAAPCPCSGPSWGTRRCPSGVPMSAPWLPGSPLLSTRWWAPSWRGVLPASPHTSGKTSPTFCAGEGWMFSRKQTKCWVEHLRIWLLSCAKNDRILRQGEHLPLPPPVQKSYFLQAQEEAAACPWSDWRTGLIH